MIYLDSSWKIICLNVDPHISPHTLHPSDLPGWTHEQERQDQRLMRRVSRCCYVDFVVINVIHVCFDVSHQKFHVYLVDYCNFYRPGNWQWTGHHRWSSAGLVCRHRAQKKGTVGTEDSCSAILPWCCKSHRCSQTLDFEHQISPNGKGPKIMAIY